ncbi:acyltransferase family protein [Liquorilactobacillus oeni]|uniref:O-acetyltransferase n=1 Tax=Liquorilactobacillus oeni DSM 19972 TaxID=1423777 RepID=A0A0R1M9A6_9LACO|nr:acyltransferase family protein [Liquorilactobacillus oeni]KRL04489.1 O-acetyltransferase [Liquorilactobacillus oeni DSM 19972]
MKRIGWIDIARALAMLMIVTGHTLFSFTYSPVARVIFAVHVPIFFVLSGYLFKEKRWKIIFSKVNHNLLLPYSATCFLIILFSWFAIHNPNNWIFRTGMETHQVVLAAFYGLGTPMQLPNKAFTIPAIGAIWFLVSMYFGDLLFNLSFKIVHKYKHKLMLLWLISIIECCIGFYLGGVLHLPLPWSLPAACVSQIFYIAGFTIKKYDFMEKNGLWVVGGLLLWLFSVHSGFFYLNTAYADSPFAAMLGGVGGSFVLMRFSKFIEKITTHFGMAGIGMFEAYGRLSLIVLCAHLFEMMLVRFGPAIHQVLVPVWGELGATIATIGYRVFFTTFAILLIPRIPFLRSFYLNKRFPFKEAAEKLSNNPN